MQQTTYMENHCSLTSISLQPHILLQTWIVYIRFGILSFNIHEKRMLDLQKGKKKRRNSFWIFKLNELSLSENIFRIHLLQTLQMQRLNCSYRWRTTSFSTRVYIKTNKISLYSPDPRGLTLGTSGISPVRT